jgi:hypothetical protein
VSLAVVASAAAVAAGVDVADALIGLAITLVILRITWRSWKTVSVGPTRTERRPRTRPHDSSVTAVTRLI